MKKPISTVSLVFRRQLPPSSKSWISEPNKKIALIRDKWANKAKKDKDYLSAIILSGIPQYFYATYPSDNYKSFIKQLVANDKDEALEVLGDYFWESSLSRFKNEKY